MEIFISGWIIFKAAAVTASTLPAESHLSTNSSFGFVSCVEDPGKVFFGIFDHSPVPGLFP